jgi:hypothetical protein
MADVRAMELRVPVVVLCVAPPGRHERQEGFMDPNSARIWQVVAFVAAAVLVFSYGSGWFHTPIPGSPM